MIQYWKSKPKWVKIFSIVFSSLLVLELILRFFVGLGDIPIYRVDKKYEYFFEANQDVWRFGNHILTNEYGMRSKKINKNKKITILEFGDSVLNGGSHIDQDKLATTLEEQSLNKNYQDQVQVLNVSAQSWGVSNAYAFLKEHGNFNSKVIVLVFSSHDLYDNMHFRNVVGVEPAWPANKPYLAITDVWSRFVWPKFKSVLGFKEYDYLIGFDDSKVNSGWDDFFNYSREKNLPILVYLHATLTEVKNGKYNKKGKKILNFCKENRVKIITDLDQLRSKQEAFIDDIHLNEIGHKIMSNLVTPELEDLLSQQL